MQFRTAAALVLFACTAAGAQQQVAIDLTGVQIRNATNQSRDSSPQTISPAYGYHYAIDGNVRGVGGILSLLYPTATPLAQVLEDFQPGASAALVGEFYNPSGAHPVEVLNQRIDGMTTISGITVTYGLTLIAGIRADNIAYFQTDNVILQPSALVGYLQFTSGTVTITRVPVVTGDMNWDGQVNGDDAQAFVLAEVDPSAYVAAYAHDPRLAGDINRDGFLDPADRVDLVQLLLSAD